MKSAFEFRYPKMSSARICMNIREGELKRLVGNADIRYTEAKEILDHIQRLSSRIEKRSLTLPELVRIREDYFKQVPVDKILKDHKVSRRCLFAIVADGRITKMVSRYKEGSTQGELF